MTLQSRICLVQTKQDRDGRLIILRLIGSLEDWELKKRLSCHGKSISKASHFYLKHNNVIVFTESVDWLVYLYLLNKM